MKNCNTTYPLVAILSAIPLCLVLCCCKNIACHTQWMLFVLILLLFLFAGYISILQIRQKGERLKQETEFELKKEWEEFQSEQFRERMKLEKERPPLEVQEKEFEFQKKKQDYLLEKITQLSALELSKENQNAIINKL